MKHTKNSRGVYFWDSGNTVISISPTNRVNRSVSTVNMETSTSMYCDAELLSVIRFLTLQNMSVAKILVMGSIDENWY